MPPYGFDESEVPPHVAKFITNALLPVYNAWAFNYEGVSRRLGKWQSSQPPDARARFASYDSTTMEGDPAIGCEAFFATFGDVAAVCAGGQYSLSNSDPAEPRCPAKLYLRGIKKVQTGFAWTVLQRDLRTASSIGGCAR
jgi:hypothetical protein